MDQEYDLNLSSSLAFSSSHSSGSFAIFLDKVSMGLHRGSQGRLLDRAMAHIGFDRSVPFSIPLPRASGPLTSLLTEFQ